MDLTDAQGNKITAEQVAENLTIPVGEGIIELANKEAVQGIQSIKASDRTRSKNLNSDRNFVSQTDMELQAEKLYAGHANKLKKEQEEDVVNGLDINDIESIKNFNICYTPLGNSVVIKQLHEEEQIGKIIIPAGLDITDRKYIVMVPGLLVNMLNRGDIITMKGTPSGKLDVIDRKFNGVKFIEVDFYAIAGIYKSEQDMQKRVEALTDKYNAGKNA